jgi:hypothetical protein
MKIGQLPLMFPPRKDDETYLFFNIYESSKGLAIIQDFVAHCAMQNEQMAQGRIFKLKSESQAKIPGFTIQFSPLIMTLILIFFLSPFAHFQNGPKQIFYYVQQERRSTDPSI